MARVWRQRMLLSGLRPHAATKVRSTRLPASRCSFVNANSKDVHPHEWMTQNTAKWDEFLDWKFSARIGKDELLKCTRNLLYCLSYFASETLYDEY